jgi:acyl-CoA thioesterase FadM
MKNLLVEYKAESFYKDVIDVKIGCADVTKVSFEFFYKLSTVRNNTQIIIANAQTTMISYKYDSKKIVSIPEKLKMILLG